MTDASAPSMLHISTSPAQSRAVNITLWVLQALLALSFVAAGAQKLGGTESVVTLFDHIGAGQWLRYVIGTLEIAGAVGVLIPALSGLSALALGLLMVGATVTNLVIDLDWRFPVGYLVLAGIVAWGRRARTRALVERFIH